MRGASGEEGEIATEMLTLWEGMLAGDWKVGKDRERRANAKPSKYTMPASVLKKITHEQVIVTPSPHHSLKLNHVASRKSLSCIEGMMYAWRGAGWVPTEHQRA